MRNTTTVIPLIAGAAFLGVALMSNAASAATTSFSVNYPPPKPRGAPFAPVGPELRFWPVKGGVRKVNYVKADGKANGAPLGVFGAPRKASGSCTQGRKHAGVDMPAAKDAPVIAIADGVIVASQGWSGPGTRALLVEHEIGGQKVVFLYGAVAPGSYAGKGTVVKAGDQIAKIGVYPKGSTMLHVEAYTGGTRRNYRWCSGQPAPSRLLDVTSILLRLADVDPA